MVGRNNLSDILTEVVKDIENRLTAYNTVAEKSHLLNCPDFGYIEEENCEYKNRDKADEIPLAVSAFFVSFFC